MKKGSGQMKGVISFFFFFSSLRVVYGRSREFFLPSTLYISPRVSKIAIEIPGIFFAEKNRGGGEAYLDSARAGREASNNSHRSLGRHSSTFLNSGCIRRMMRGVSSRDSPFSRRFSSLSLSLSLQKDYYCSPATRVLLRSAKTPLFSILRIVVI